MIFISACMGFSVVLIIVASSQLSSAMPLAGTMALVMAIMSVICCYDPEELGSNSSDSMSGMGDEDDAFRQTAKDNGAVLSGVLLSIGFGINILLWRYNVGYSTIILVLTIIGNTLLMSAIISAIWLFCFATRVWDDGDSSMVGTIEW